MLLISKHISKDTLILALNERSMLLKIKHISKILINNIERVFNVIAA